MDVANSLGIENAHQLELAARLPKNNLAKYFGGVNPRSHILLRLTELLGAPPSYLYGRPVEAVKKNVVEMVRRVFGPEEATVLEVFADMDSEQRRTLLQMLSGIPRPNGAISAFERDSKERAARAARYSGGSKKK